MEAGGGGIYEGSPNMGKAGQFASLGVTNKSWVATTASSELGHRCQQQRTMMLYNRNTKRGATAVTSGNQW